jgi:hypothetical protein
MIKEKKKILYIIGISSILFIVFSSCVWINNTKTTDDSIRSQFESSELNNREKIHTDIKVPEKQYLNLSKKLNDIKTPLKSSKGINKRPKDIKTKGTNLTPKEAYAIVVGVADYPGSSADLSYTDDDAQDIYSLLVDEYNFKEENIIYLQDSAATRGTISNAFDQVAAQMSEDDIFFFYYSGHGGFGTEAGPYSVNVQSPHNYPNNYDNTWSISHSGAAYMRVHFYRLETEYNYDFILCGDSTVYSDYYYELFSGNYGYNFWSSYIPVDRYYIRLISDYSYTYYGFRIDKYEAILDDGTHYLCSYDSIPDSPENYYIDDLLDLKLDNLDAAEKYVVVDSCHSGGLIPEVEEMGRYIMTACEADEYSLENPDLQHGVFTNYFLESTTQASDSNGDGILSMEECYDYTRDNTISFSSGEGYTHHPMESDNIPDESILNTAFGSVQLNQSGNSLNYSFTMHGIGLINELKVGVYDYSEGSYNYNITDLTALSTSDTGFESYSGVIQLNGFTGLTGYGIYAQITGNEILKIYNIFPSQLDSDNDGLKDMIEIFYETNPLQYDTDGDGLGDLSEFNWNTNPLSNDTDMDQMLDLYEVTYGLNPNLDDSDLDIDGDGLNNLLEHNLGTHPDDKDTDGDQMDDGWEYQYRLNLFIDDANSDNDFDGLTNIFEYRLLTVPIAQDSDSDSLLDGAEVFMYSTDPKIADTDSDGTLDGVEITLNTNPLDPRDSNIKIILNMIGIAILVPLGCSGTIMSIRYIQKRKKGEIGKGESINSFKIKMKPNTYNSLETVKIKRPQRKLTSSYYSYRPSSLPHQSYKSYHTPYGDSMKSKIEDIILYRLPPPEPPYTEKGKNAKILALMASNDLKSGRMQEAAEKMIQALLLGVPEPYNTQIKQYLLDSLNMNRIKTNYLSSSSSKNLKTNLIKCPYCNQINEPESKFCIKCGKRVEQQPNPEQGIVICKNCGTTNQKGNNFCIKCGGKL